MNKAELAQAVPVIAQGFGWTAAGAWATFLTLLGLIIRQLGPWRKQTQDAEQKLRDDLIRRVERLERTLEVERAHRDAERALDRHRLNNVTQCFDAMILLLEAAPDRAGEIVVKIKEMRAAQIKAEALEKATIKTATIMAAADGAEEAGA